MTDSKDNRTTRRELFRSLGRGAALAGLGAVVAALIGKTAPAGEQPCAAAGRCAGCARLDDCRLPRGMSARQVLHEGADGAKSTREDHAG